MLITKQDIPAFQLLQWKYAIKIQMETGLGHSKGSVPKFVAEKFGMPYRKGKLAKVDMAALIVECDARLLEHDHATNRHVIDPACRTCISLGLVK
jgi:hypothetical protein